MTALSLKKNFAWTFVGQISIAAAQWLVITLIARQTSAGTLGQYAFALAICSPVVILAELRLRSVQASDSLQEFSFLDYLSLRIVALTVAFCSIIGLAILLRGWNTSALLIVVIGAAKCIDSISDVIYGYHQRHERMDRVSRSFLSRSVLLILCFIAGFFIAGTILGGAFGILVSSLAVLVVVDMPQWNKTRVQFSSGKPFHWSSAWSTVRLRSKNDLNQMKRLFHLSLPLGITSSISSLTANVPRYFLEVTRGPALLGIYAALIYPLTAGNMMMGAIAQSAAPRLANFYRRGDYRLFQRLLLRLIAGGIAIGVAGVVAAILVGGFLLELLYGQEYAQYKWIFVWAMVNVGIKYLYLFLGTALTAMKRFGVQLPIHLTSLVVLIIACWLLVEPYGLTGAMMSITFASSVEAALYISVVASQIRSNLLNQTTR